MKILYFAFVELDIPNACQAHSLGVLRGFSDNSCKIDAIVPHSKKVHPKLPGVFFYYLWPWSFSTIGRLWIRVLCGLFLFGLCFIKKYDAIYVRELEANPFPRWCSKVFRVPLYIEINGILLQNMVREGKDIIRMRRAERHQAGDFKQATGLVVPSFSRCKWIIDHYNLNPEKVHMILNGTEIIVRSKRDRSRALAKLKLPQDGYFLGFLGNIWEYYDLSCILKAMEICLEDIPNLHMILIGSGPEIGNLLNQWQERKVISRLVFVGYVQQESLFEVMEGVDVGLMNLTKKGLQDLGPVTTRFATYAAFKVPVIANDLYIGNYPQEIREGLSLVAPEDPHALADMIHWLYTHPRERKEKADILHDFVIRKLTWNAVTEDILEIINRDKRLN